jgi:diguanylate cyclase (GGDEF)-like protein
MTENNRARKNRIAIDIYSSSAKTSMIAVSIICVLEIVMLALTIVFSPLYGENIWRYRAFYISFFLLSFIYILVCLFAKKDMEHRYRILNYANPVFTVGYFAWALSITYSDYLINGTIDPTIFMTFSLAIPMVSYLFPCVYVGIVAAADLAMLYMTVAAAGFTAPILNLFVFFIFQIVTGISFMRLKAKYAERIIDEQANAEIDVMTGFLNRRVYEEDMKSLVKKPPKENIIYISIDLNGLKEVNDRYGHETGDELIVGAAQCLNDCFKDRGKIYRLGGDEFVVLLYGDKEELNKILPEYEAALASWAGDNDLPLSTACGYACRSDYPGLGVVELAKIADGRMYEAKVNYYKLSGNDRRSYARAETPKD